jgi:hypothetical protein
MWVSMYARARSTAEFDDFAWLGRQRWQARNPAPSAAAAEEKNATLSRFGRFDGHDGRQ